MNKTLPALPGKASALPPGAFETGAHPLSTARGRQCPTPAGPTRSTR